MPKMKTHRMAYKKFRVGGKGTPKRAQANKSHLTSKRSAKRIRQLRGLLVVDDTNKRDLRRLLPFAGI